jgi:maltose O-acetyltransferase
MLKVVFDKVRLMRGRLEERKRRLYIEGLVRRGLVMGNNVQIVADIFLDPSHCFLIRIGDNVTFAPNVRIIAHDASTKQFLGSTRIASVRIMDDCFIGDSVIVMPGVTIGPRVIVGAGSVVTRDIPPDSVAAGNPARVIGALDEYLKKRKSAAAERKVFGPEYHIERLDDRRRAEILDALSKGPGFID